MHKVYTLVIFMIGSFCVHSQSKTIIKDISVSNTKAVFLGKTERVDRLVSKARISGNTKAKKQSKNLPPNFFGRKSSKLVRPDLEYQGADPLRKEQRSNDETALTPILNFDGIGDAGSPHDPSGAIGQNHYVQAINATDIGVFLKDGSLVETFSGNVFWENFDQSSAGDPIVLYDTEYHQWIITEFAPQSTSLLLVAISENEDPLGVYSLYAFATPEFPDYPKYGIWDNALVVTTNEGGTGALHQYFIERETLMAGEEDVTIQRVEVNGNNTEAGFFVTTPVNWSSGPTPKESKPVVVKLNDSAWGEVSEDQVEIISFDIDFANPDNTTVEELAVPVTPFDANPCSVSGDGFQCVPQKDGGGLDAIPEVIMNVPQYRNYDSHESFVLSFITDVSDGENLAGIRWMEMRRIEGEDWKLYQEGTYSPDGLDRYMSSIALDAEGNIGLAYNVSSEDEFVGVRFTGRRSDDPLGQMTFAEAEAVKGTNQINSGGRFGDYAHMTLDPVDGQTFWYTTEYAGNGGSSSKTRILSFKIADSRANDLLAAGILSPTSSASLSAAESVKVLVVNQGNTDATNFDLQLVLGDDEIGTYTHTEVLAAGEELEYTFSNTVDMSALGSYALSLNISYSDDFADNNSFSTTIKQLISLDGEIKLRSDKSVTCLEDAILPIDLRILNNGFENVTSADIDLIINESVQKTIAWTGDIERGRSSQVKDAFTDLPSGDLVLKAVLKNVNGGTDQNQIDNEIALEISNNLDLDQIVIKITPDDYPSEIGWVITDGTTNGQVFARSSSYAGSTPGVEIEDFACVPMNQCFQIIVFDTFGDGFCCGANGDGSYQVVAPDGSIIFEGQGDFEQTRATDFCLGTGCEIGATIETVAAQGSTPGSIVLTASGGSNYQYSVDGGDNFQDSPVFDGLVAGTYEVVITAGFGCEFTQTVEVGEEEVLGSELHAESLLIAPNPTKGVIALTISGYAEVQGFLEVEVVNLDGKVLQLKKVSRYDDSFKGSISLYDYPAGIYLLRLKNVSESRLIRVIKK